MYYIVINCYIVSPNDIKHKCSVLCVHLCVCNQNVLERKKERTEGEISDIFVVICKENKIKVKKIERKNESCDL